jgi:hypothetical protein
MKNLPIFAALCLMLAACATPECDGASGCIGKGHELSMKHEYSSARPYFARAVEIIESEAGEHDGFDRNAAYFGLCEGYYYDKEYQNALDCFNAAMIDGTGAYITEIREILNYPPGCSSPKCANNFEYNIDAKARFGLRFQGGSVSAVKELSDFTMSIRGWKRIAGVNAVGFDGKDCAPINGKEDAKSCVIDGAEIPIAEVQERLAPYFLEARNVQGGLEYCPSPKLLREIRFYGRKANAAKDYFFANLERDERLGDPLGWESYSVSDWEKLRSFVARWEKFYRAHPEFRDLPFYVARQFGCDRITQNMDDAYADGYLGNIVEDANPEERAASYRKFLEQNKDSKYHARVKEALDKLEAKD